ncbi:MAG TPA: class I SAM-dependent methyltransferase [Sumerlaeia bacterium]|nr:class I SAM-dependent methyltransferase [Sumerlaeia bacterium]
MRDEKPDAAYTLRTRDWLDRAFSLRTDDGGCVSHQPIHGFGRGHSAPHQAPRIARTGRILALLAREMFEDFLDVGAGEAYTADLVRELFGAKVAACDLSREACMRGRELFGVPTFAANAARLPLADRSFDCVLCSEALEHLEDPFAALSELVRVTRRILMITTQECGRFERQRRLVLKTRRLARPHAEINWWVPRDFRDLLGPRVELHRQNRPDGWPLDRERDLEVVKRWLRHATDPERLNREGVGVIAVWRRAEDAPPQGDSGAARASGAAPPGPNEVPKPKTPRTTGLDMDQLWDMLLQPRPTGRNVADADEAWLRERLRCPLCVGPLEHRVDGLGCAPCGRAWSPHKGLPDLTAAELGMRKPEVLDVRQVQRLKRIFRPDNVWGGKKAALGEALLGAVELVRDLYIRRGFRRALELFLKRLGEAAREFDPRAEGWLVRVRGDENVYRIEKGRRRFIASPQVFFERGYTVEQIREVDPQWLKRFPDGDPIDSA